MPYTVEVYKKDRRVKKGTGERLVRKTDHSTDDLNTLKHLYETTWFASEGYRMEYHKTYVERINLMSGLPYQERYDTPYSCSPSSETYWST
jgi:hypothetical protein